MSVLQMERPTCGQCGRYLGVGYFYKCLVCGATFCYAHAPNRCEHKIPA